MSNYPQLPEDAVNMAQQTLDKFKRDMSKIADNSLRDLYANILPYLESDSWTNFTNELLDGLKDYPNSKIRNKYDFVKIRAVILKENRESIIKDLDQDILSENEKLKEQIKNHICL